MIIAGALVVRASGAAPKSRCGEGPRSGRGLRARHRHIGVLWEQGRPVGVLGTKHRKRMNRFTNILATASRLPDDVERNGGSQLKAPRFDRQREDWGEASRES